VNGHLVGSSYHRLRVPVQGLDHLSNSEREYNVLVFRVWASVWSTSKRRKAHWRDDLTGSEAVPPIAAVDAAVVVGPRTYKDVVAVDVGVWPVENLEADNAKAGCEGFGFDY
jgi:hypothetical protein